MAENDYQDRDRTESPSQRRLEQARSRGQVPRSRDLGAAMVVLVGGLGLYSLAPLTGGRLLALMRDGLTLSSADATDASAMFQHFEHAVAQGLLGAAPLLALLLLAAALAPLMIGGWAVSFQTLAPDLSRLDLVAGLGRIFSLRGLIELGKAFARFIVVALVTVVVLSKEFRSFTALGSEPGTSGIVHSMTLIGAALIALAGGLGVIAVVDVPLALWQYQRSLRMTRQELRDEQKDTEGSPEIKLRVRRLQQQQARKRMMQQVPKADVVVTNPTHYAVALRYDEPRMRAPVVVAKGVELIALTIREIALEHKIPIIEAPPLARALHASCELGGEIPAQLYAAVAKVLIYVYQLRAAGRGDGPQPARPHIDVPGEPPAS